MSIAVPSAAEIREALRHLTLKQIDELAVASKVPASTIYKIKRGETENPGIETLGKFLPFVPPAPDPNPEPAVAKVA